MGDLINLHRLHHLSNGRHILMPLQMESATESGCQLAFSISLHHFEGGHDKYSFFTVSAESMHCYGERAAWPQKAFIFTTVFKTVQYIFNTLASESIYTLVLKSF